MSNKNVLVTGATGHIGSRLVIKLLENNYKVTALIRKESEVSKYLEYIGASMHICNLNKEETFIKLLKSDTVVFHLAAENSTETNQREKTIENTYGLTKSFISVCLKANVKKIIYTSSVVVLGRSKNKENLIDLNDKEKNMEIPYVAGKILAEDWISGVNKQNSDIRIIYPSWVIGQGYNHPTPPHIFLNSLIYKKNFFCIEGGISLAHVDDVASGHIKVLENGKKNGRYIFSGHNISFKELYNQINKRFNKKEKFITLPTKPLKILCKLMGKYSPIEYNYAKNIIGNYSWYKSSNAIKIGYEIRSLNDMFKDIEIDIQKRSLKLNIFQYLNSSNNFISENKKTLLITGFPGWLGNRVVQNLISNENYAKNRPYKKIKLLVQEKFIHLLPKLPNYFEVLKGDLTNFDSISSALSEVDCVWHLAGCIYPKYRKTHYLINHIGTENIAKACIKNSVKRLIYMSTDSVCGFSRKNKRYFNFKEKYNPYKDYGKSKYLAEKLLMKYTSLNLLDVTILRGFWFFGPNIPPRNKNFLNSFLWPIQIVFGNGKNLRSITHLDDVFNALVKASNSSKAIGKSYWISSLTETKSVNQIYFLIADALKKKPFLVHIPNFVCEIISVFDYVYTSISGKINPTLLAAGKFHKDIANSEKNKKFAKSDFGWESRVNSDQIKKEIYSEMFTKNH